MMETHPVRGEEQRGVRAGCDSRVHSCGARKRSFIFMTFILFLKFISGGVVN